MTVSDTSKQSYARLNSSGAKTSEKVIVLELLKRTGALNSRAIAMKTDLERGNVTRTLFDLESSGKIRVAYINKCHITGKNTKFYIPNV